MSRIDEALSRVKAGDDSPSAAAPGQALFRPAWPLAATEASPVEPAHRLKTGGAAVGFSSAWRERLANSPEASPGLVEQFRRLASTLHKAQRVNGLRSVMVTSATPGDGKTLTAINLALVLAESFHSRVLLVDADLRRPSIPSAIEMGDGAGLSEALTATTDQQLALVTISPMLTLLPAGQPIANSIEAVTSPRMHQILAEASTRYDWVILDAPPVGITTDARLLAELVGGTLFVVRAGKSQHTDVMRGITALGREHILGVVLNGVEQDGVVGYYGEPRPAQKD